MNGSEVYEKYGNVEYKWYTINHQILNYILNNINISNLPKIMKSEKIIRIAAIIDSGINDYNSRNNSAGFTYIAIGATLLLALSSFFSAEAKNDIPKTGNSIEALTKSKQDLENEIKNIDKLLFNINTHINSCKVTTEKCSGKDKKLIEGIISQYESQKKKLLKIREDEISYMDKYKEILTIQNETLFIEKQIYSMPAAVSILFLVMLFIELLHNKHAEVMKHMCTEISFISSEKIVLKGGNNIKRSMKYVVLSKIKKYFFIKRFIFLLKIKYSLNKSRLRTIKLILRDD